MELEEIKLFIDTKDNKEKALQLQELENSIRAQDRDSLIKEYKREKEDKSTLDIGTILVALLSAPAMVTLAKGIAAGIRIIAKGIADYYSKKGAKTVKIKIGYESYEIPTDTPEKLAEHITKMVRR